MSTITSLTKRVNKAMNEYETQKASWAKEKDELNETITDLNIKKADYEEEIKKLKNEIHNLDDQKYIFDKNLTIINNENISLKEEIEKLTNKITSLQKSLEEKDTAAEKNAGDIIEMIEKEKGWNIREKQLIDGFTSFKDKTYKTIKHLVEDVIEPLEEKVLENPESVIVEEQLKEQIEDIKKSIKAETNTAEVTIRTNGGPAETKKLVIRPAERELQEMIENTKS